MRRKLEVLSLAVLLAAGTISSTASAAPIALGLRSGTLGLYGAEATLGLSDRINLRVPFSAFDYHYDDDSDGVDYKGKLKLQSFGGQIDLHPFKGSFYLTAGLFANDNRLKLHARDTTGTEVYELGDNDVSFRSDPNDPLTLDGHVKFGSTAPFLGLGWGNAIQGASSFYFRFELGALFQDSTEVGLAATGSAIPEGSNQSFDTEGNTPQGAAFRQTLAQERDKLDADVSDALKIYPSVNIALGFRFGQ